MPTAPPSRVFAQVVDILKARFRPSISQIKTQIDVLIDKEYIARTDDRQTYSYLA